MKFFINYNSNTNRTALLKCSFRDTFEQELSNVILSVSSGN